VASPVTGGLRRVAFGCRIYNRMVVDEVTDAEVDRLFHALADATRRDIVRRVLVAEHSVSELARDYPMSVTAVQKHVAVLEGAGLVTKRRLGREQRVAGQPGALHRAQALLDAYEQLWRHRFDRMGDVLAEGDRGGSA
jgi:DNA-binding transcriptional ArsR family regulator